jgi:adenylate cyclase
MKALAAVQVQRLNVARRLAAVLSADAQGYSRLMSEDDIGTVRTLTAHRAVMRDAVARFHGRVVDAPGDNLLAEFPTAPAAVACAVEIQQSLRARNAELPERRRLEFRIGVNAGEVIADGDRIYGDPVNVAARLEGLAQAGGLCVSGAVHDEVSGRLSLDWEALGEQTMKNIARPVRVYRASLRGSLAPERARRPADRSSMAVDSESQAILFVLRGLDRLYRLILREVRAARGRRSLGPAGLPY